MYGLKEMLLQEKKHLEDILAKVSRNNNSSPEGRLRISVDHGNEKPLNLAGYGTVYPDFTFFQRNSGKKFTGNMKE